MDARHVRPAAYPAPGLLGAAHHPRLAGILRAFRFSCFPCAVPAFRFSRAIALYVSRALASRALALRAFLPSVLRAFRSSLVFAPGTRRA